MKDWPLLIEDEPGLTATEIEARARVIGAKLKSTGKTLDLVIVDHIHKCRHPGAQSKVSEYTEISARLAEAAKRLNCPVIALAQLNRALRAETTSGRAWPMFGNRAQSSRTPIWSHSSIAKPTTSKGSAAGMSRTRRTASS